MSNENTQIEQIAKLLKDSETSKFETISARLDLIEKKLDSLQTQPVQKQSVHPSQQKFDVIEAIVDELFDADKTEKTCTFEPNGKPCDYCSMCSSRGF